MFKTRASWCEKLILFSVISLILITCLDYKFIILPFNGIYLIIYILFLITITTWITFICLQSLLQQDKPFKYDFENNSKLKLIGQFFNNLNIYSSIFKNAPNLPEKSPSKDSKALKAPKNIDERINEFVKDVEARFILKWYSHISNDPSFPKECKVLLDEILRRFLQIIVEVDGRKLFYGCTIIFLKHIKEFRKTIKRSQKTGGSIDESFRYSHIGSKSSKAMEHFIFRLTANILKQFINWELWVSIPCQSLVSILSKRFTTFILTYVASPGYLNYKIVQACGSEVKKSDLKLDDFYFISVSDVDHAGNLTKDISQVDTNDAIKKSEKPPPSRTPLATPKKIMKTPHGIGDDDGIRQAEVRLRNEPDNRVKLDSSILSSKPIDIISSRKIPETKAEKVGLKVSEPVKIHESKSSSNKTWRNSSDLECISLGQDLLAFQEFSDPDSQIQELIEKKLWKDNAEAIEDEKLGPMWDIPEAWDAEEDVIDVIDEGPASPTSNFQSYLKSTANTASYIAKPISDVTASTLHNMKELQQTTVNTVNTVVKPMSQATTNAMHKIGDLQDEAAGMVEGILDFGMAGLRKGLRLTGLQDNFNELTQKAKNEFQKVDSHKPMHFAKVTMDSIKIREKESRGEEIKSVKNVGKLHKSPCIVSEEKPDLVLVSSESEESVWINPLTKDSPTFDGHILLEKTPNVTPQSDDATEEHFIRSQTAQSYGIPQITEEILSSRNSPDPEYEETQDFATTIAKLRTLLQQKSSESGYTTPALSPLMHDELAKTPSEPPPADLSKVDGAMPSLYKFCARTATGVFQNTLNTIKTALPGNLSDLNHSNMEDWTFVEADSLNDDFHSRVKKLLSERRAFCTIDTAYEAIDSLDVNNHAESSWNAPVSPFDDELDELDVQVPLTKALLDIVCELIADTNTSLLQESVVKAHLILIGNFSEELVTKWSDNLLHNVKKFIGKLPENNHQDVMTLKLNEIVTICMEKIPYQLRLVLGENTIESGVNIFITSLQSHKINQDMFLQMFELFASELINACSQVSPTYSA